MANVRIDHFFHPDSFTYTYVVAEADGDHCVIIDSALDYDPKSGRTATVAADEIVAHVRANNLVVEWILETHPQGGRFCLQENHGAIHSGHL